MRTYLLLFSSLALMASACAAQRLPTTVSPTPPELSIQSPTVQSSTGTQLPPRTPLPTMAIPEPAPTHTHRPKGPPLPKATQSPAETATPSQATFAPAPLPDPSITYSLQSPDQDHLLAVIDLAVKVQRDARTYYDDGYLLSEVMMSDSDALDNLVSRDIRRYYPDGLVNMPLVMDAHVRRWYSPDILPPDKSIRIILQSGVVPFITAYQRTLTDREQVDLPPTTILPFSLNLDDDPQPEWLVQADFVDFDFRTWVPVDGDHEVGYRMIPNEISGVSLAPGSVFATSLDLGHDLNGDRQVEIVVLSAAPFHGGAAYTIGVYAASPSGVHPLGDIRFDDFDGVSPAFLEEAGKYSVADIDGDGREEIRIVLARYGVFDCRWEEVSTYRWAGRQPVFTVAGMDIPGISPCYIAKALASDRASERIFWLKEAIAVSEAQAEAGDMLTWQQVQLAAAYAGQRLDKEAKRVLREIIDRPNTGVLADMVRVAFAGSRGDPVAVCRTLHDYVYQSYETGSGVILGSDIDRLLSLRVFVGTEEVEPADPGLVCPYPELVQNRLKATYLSSHMAPVEALAAAGYIFSQPEAFNLDTDPQLEWVGMLESDTYAPHLVVLDTAGGVWQVMPLLELGLDAIISLVPYDASGDGTPQVLAVAQYTSMLFPGELSSYLYWGTYTCETEGKTVELALIGLREEEFGYLERKQLCGDQDLPNLATDQGRAALMALLDPRQQMPAWFQLDGLASQTGGATDVVSFADAVDELILSQERPAQTRAEVEAVMGGLPGDDLAARLLWARLKYIIGYSHELAGEYGQATAVYLELIERAPESPWSWLAWARLTPQP